MLWRYSQPGCSFSTPYVRHHAVMRRRRDLLVGLPAAAGSVAFVTAAIAALKPYVPVLSLAVLYELAILPVAVLWGVPLATAVSIASMLAFNWFCLPPTLRNL